MSRVSLFVMPHMDDEAISCGGLIQVRKAQGYEVHVVAVYDRQYDYGKISGFHEENIDFRAAVSALGVDRAEAWGLHEGEPSQVGYLPVLELIERYMEQVHPFEVIVPSAQDINQDHQFLSRVMAIALRPFNLASVVRVLEFHGLDGTLRKPNYFVGLTPTQMQSKLRGVLSYRRESREGTNSSRTTRNIEAQAAIWGAAANLPLAEGYTMIMSREMPE